MQPRRNLNDVYSGAGQNHHMFLRQLSSSFLPHSRPALCRAGFSGASYLPHFLPAPHPWWSAQRFPPRPPGLPPSHPAAHQVYSGRTFHTWSISSSDFGGSRRSFHASAGLMMERHDRDRGPPQKRRKSVEEKRSLEERGGAAGGSKREHHQPDSSTDGRPRQNRNIRDGSRDRGRNGAVSQDNCRDREEERTKSKSQDRQKKGETSPHWRSPHQHGGHKDSQQERPKSKPEHRKPNPWFKERSEEGGRERTSEGQVKDGWRGEGANREPPPPGSCPPVPQQEDVTSRKSLERHWEPSPSACTSYPLPPGCSTAFDFSVMSYNILSQELLQDNAYLYRHCHPGVLPWKHRLPNLLAEIQQYDADILCLQEVQEDHYENQIKPALQALGYQCEYKKRTGSKPDGCAVIFKSSRLSLLSSNPVEYLRPGDALLDRDNVGLVLLLRPNDATAAQPDPSAFICVANTHLLYNPRRGDIKLAQLAILLAEIRRLSRRSDGSTSPVVLCGDFNSTPWSPLYSFLTTGCLDYRGMQIGMVSGQESNPRGQRLLPSPIWSNCLGIDHQCQYNKPSADSSSPTAVEGAISTLTVEDLANTAAAAAYNRARIEHGLKLQSSYQHRLMPDGRPEITTCHSRTAMTVDYILFTPEFVTPPSLPGGWGLQLLGRLSLVGQSELEEVDGLPNRHHSSDHLPLLTRFRLRR
ncbi:protein angel homolog 2 isoform X1 [Labrus bergylta]|uniref:protein angel homolog 2 isoform X1 n=2 Tax=Labrus bergylta TaxID=56723 RepID=UPI003313FA56